MGQPPADLAGAPGRRCARDVFPQVDAEAMKMGARKTIILATAGAFHTEAMRGAYVKFNEFIKNDVLLKPKVPVVTNIEGTASLDPVELLHDIVESLINPVNWMRMMEYLKTNSVASYVEVGPGTSLSSLCRINGIERDYAIHAGKILAPVN